MKKLFMLMFMLILLVGTISAFEFDNIGNYDEETQTIDIRNSILGIPFLQLDKIAEVKLDTPLVNYVIRGKNRLVAEFTIESFKDYTEGTFDDMDFYDIKRDMKKFDRNFVYRYKDYYDVEVEDYEKVCKEREVINSTGTIIEKYNCYDNQVGTHLEKRFKWVELNDKADLLKGIITIGIFTDVYANENIEWIPTLFGVKIGEWAEWTEALNVDLWAYYNFDASSGTVLTNELGEGDRNGTLMNMGDEDWVTGLLGNALTFDGSNDFINFTGDDPFGGYGGNFTLSWWENRTSIQTTVASTFGYLLSGVVQPLQGYINADSQMCFIGSTNGVSWDLLEPTIVFCGGTVEIGNWTNFALTRAGDTWKIYKNGAVQNSTTDTGAFWNSGSDFKLGAVQVDYTNSLFDELLIARRAWSDAEMIQFYNEGTGITYSPLTPIVNVIQSFPANNTYTIDVTPDFGCNFTGLYNENVTDVTILVYDSSDNLDYTDTESSLNTPSYNKTWLDVALDDDTYLWACYGEGFTDDTYEGNRTLVVDSTSPVISIVYPTAIPYNSNQSVLNYTYVDDNTGLCFYSIDGGANNSSTSAGGINFTNVHSIEGSNTWVLYCNDSLGNTANDSVVFTQDSTYPLIDFGDGTQVDNYNSSANSIYANVSVTEINEQNITFLLWNSTAEYDSSFYETAIRNINWTGLNDDVYTYNVSVCDVLGLCNTTETRTITIDTTNPIINVTYPTGNIPYHLSGNNLTLNWTADDPHIQNCWYDYNTTNISVTCGDNTTQILITENSNKNVTFYANDSFGNEGSYFKTWNIKVIEINQTYNNQTTEGSLETFLANISLGPGFSITNIYLNYNNSLTIGQSFASGKSTILRKADLLIPNVDENKNLSFYWDIILSDSTHVNLSIKNQSVFNLGLDNCSVFAIEILNFTVVDEEEQTRLPNATIEIAVNIYDETRTIQILNLSNIYEKVNPLRICLSRVIGVNTSYSLDTIVRYEDDGFANEYYNIVDYTLENASALQHITLYDLNISDSTEFQLTFTGSDFLSVENALVSVNRQYISENIFKTVELPKTDFNGQTVLHLVRNDVVYNIQIIKSGEVLGTFENIVAFCDDFSIGDCNIDLNAFDSVTSIFDYDADLGIIFNDPEYDNATNTISFDFVTSDGTSKLVYLEVSRNDIFGNRSICNDSLTSSGGTLICNIDPSIDESVLKTNVYVDGVLAVTSNVKLDTTNYGVAGYLIMFVMAISFILMFSGSKTGVLISIILTLAGSIGLGLVSGNLIGIGASGLWLIVIILIGIFKLNKERIP